MEQQDLDSGRTPDSRPAPGAAPELGPVAVLAFGVRDGSIGLDVARERARAHGAHGDVTPTQVRAMAGAGVSMAGDGRWRDGRIIVELCYAAVEAAARAQPGERALTESWLVTGADLIQVLHTGLLELGDIRLWLRAQDVAGTGVTAARDARLFKLEGLLSQRIGLLLLDAYTANRSPANYRSQFQAWVDKALHTNDPDLRFMTATPYPAADQASQAQAGQAPGTPPQDWPPPLAALDTVAEWLNRALPLVAPQRRGRTLKALAQTVEWREYLGGPADHERLRDLCEQALRELDPDDTQPRMAVQATLARIGVTAGGGPMTAIERDWPGLVARAGQREAWDVVNQAVQMLQNTDPARALALLQRHRDLGELWPDDALRGTHYQAELTLFGRAYPGAEGNPADPDRLIQQAGEAATPEAARLAAAALVRFMTGATTGEPEAGRLRLAGPLAALDHSLWAGQREAEGYLIACLLQGEAVNRAGAGDLTQACGYQRQAADAFRGLALAGPMMRCVEDADALVAQGAEGLDEATAWLAAYSLDMELAAPSAAPPLVQRLVGHLLARQAAEGTSAEVVQLLMQVAKGRRFTAMLRAGTRDFALSGTTSYLLGEEAKAEAAAAASPGGGDVLRPQPFDAELGDDQLAAAWVDEFETGPSQTPDDVVSNLQRAVERTLTASLVPAAVAPLAMLAELRSCLDPRTALLLLLEAPGRGDGTAVWQLLLTKDFEAVEIGDDPTPFGLAQATWRERAITMPMNGFAIAAARRAVQADPGPLDVAPDGAAALASLAERYLRVVASQAARLRAAGVTGLVIVPHGAGRQLPLHLAGPPGKPLAGDWAVSYLASLGQLSPARAAAQPRQGAAVFGLSYADQPELPRLDDSADEVTAIAAECGTTPLLDGQATETAFVAALQSSRYVHLRAHGRLYPDAPSFHTVFLHPDGARDGRLRAYEVLPLDLAGLELVTLGACETAMMKVDAADNPRGLPAALLLARARAVIGTLWPVLAPASTCFFTQLYRGLMTGQLDVRAAFAAAQRATCQQFPQYRDWGAFYLLGGIGKGS
jgi:CHAT domain-containing protein